MNNRKKHKGKAPTTSTSKFKRDDHKTMRKQAEVLGLVRLMMVVALVIQLMVEFGPHTVAP